MLIDLIRHGNTGRSGYLDGRTDPELTAPGRTQFEAQVRGYAWSRIVTSPRRRAHAAAARLAAATHTPLGIDGDWAEYDFGAWDGCDRAKIEGDTAGAAALAAFYRDPVAHPPPDAEPWQTFSTRVSTALHRVLDSGAGPLLIVTHAGPIRMALSLATGIPHAHTWAFRISYATRLRLNVGRDADNKLWAEVIELAQPPPHERMP
jgi:alpha-ribazole phosphatase